ncbi:MAG: carbamoyl-phosphate synthase large subunit [Opitutales bacterium]|nr:carbamoyl-phosphate synthase large subunit [Opitutales bacterium]
MAIRNDIKTVMIIGSGPIVIGQACEFDYSGTQACKALRECGYKIVLVNSNPATIMTDTAMADVTYIEPLNEKRIEQIIEKERPDALLPNLGGQTGLNLAIELNKKGVLEKYGVKVIGVNLEAIERGEDRLIFKETMSRIGIDMPKSDIAYSVEDAVKISERLGFPLVVRPAYTMGGAGGGLVYNLDELKTIVARGLQASMTGQCLIEESILGWEELEVEVVRDATGKMISVCFIENVDPCGVHTGDSFCTAPMMTVPVAVQNELQKKAWKIIDTIGVIGGTNVQFARNPKDGRVVIIEINPRTSRSSALASKATGFPIALISAKLASGLNLCDIPYWRDGTLDKYTPGGDYVVVKFARWAFEKFKGVQDKLGTQMKAVGEVMSIGKNYKEAFQKAIRSLEIGRMGLGFAKNFNTLDKDELLALLQEASSERHFVIYEALRKGATIDEIFARTNINRWFLEQSRELVELEEKILETKGALPSDDLLVRAKKDGFADAYLAKILDVPEKLIREKRISLGVVERWEAVPVSGVENACYYFSTYADSVPVNPAPVSSKKKVMVLGGGPNRIGQGIEFDYCCCHAAMALRRLGYETIMVNCNPETVSTDYDTSDKLYFEPLTLEDVLAIYEHEKPEGVIVQFGGQTPLNLARKLSEAGVRILGTSIDTIDTAEDRDLFRLMMQKLEIPMPEAGMAINIDEALAIAHKVGYPVMIRPSFVLGGRGMEVVYDDEALKEYVSKAIGVTEDAPLLIDRFLRNALECECDALSDGTDVFVPSVMEHIELAGIHSGDSACVIPPVHIPEKQYADILLYTKKIAQELGVVGLMNMQYAIEDGKVYVIEANPRASRTVPLVSKVCNIQMASAATELMMGKKLSDLNLKAFVPGTHYGVKEALMPFDKFPEVDPVLGPEMRSTGEVLGIAPDFGTAFYKAEEAANYLLPFSGTVLVTIAEKTQQALEIGKGFAELGFTIKATAGTYDFFSKNGIPCQLIKKQHEGRPNIVDGIVNKEISLIINTPVGKRSIIDDSYIRKNAIKLRVPYFTTLAAAAAVVEGIRAAKAGKTDVLSLQAHHKALQNAVK